MPAIRFIRFYYNGSPNIIGCKGDETMKIICKRFCYKMGIEFDKYSFKYDDSDVNLEIPFNDSPKAGNKNSDIMNIYVNKK